jgi:alpha-beta hydrolase superfamily lysophospholipase
VLLVHGTADRTVPLSDAHRIYRNRIDDQVRFLAIPDAGHDSTDRVERHADELLAFLDATLKPLAQRRGPKRPAKATA